MFGCFYFGESQIIFVVENYLNYIVMIVFGVGGVIGKVKSSYGYFGVFENGVFNLVFFLGWFIVEGVKNIYVIWCLVNYESRMSFFMNYFLVLEIVDNVVFYEIGFNDFIKYFLIDSWWDEQGYIVFDDEFFVVILYINDWFDQIMYDIFKFVVYM